jgi:hypothetical protein
MSLEKTVTVRVKVDSRIADLVYFVKALRTRAGVALLEMTDDELVEAAESFWDTQHGED